MVGRGSSWMTLCVILIHSISSQCTSTTNNGEVYIQADNELRFMIDGIPLPISAADSLIISDKGGYTRKEHALPVSFNPPTLDFDTQPVGMPSLRRITITNRLKSETLHLVSISGSTPHFHCSFFKDKVLQPGRNTTFDVVFLARQIGNVEHALKIQTDHGVFMYHVFGVGVSNPYRLKPLIGARVPVNGSYSPIITMHNPFSNSLQVVEMFSSGGNLHLELPTGAAEASPNMWELQPYETKPVMRATFLASQVKNETGYIRIRTKSPQGRNDLMIVPLEVEVSGVPGLYSPQHILDFGVLHTQSEPKSIPVFVINNSIKPVEITDISLESSTRHMSIEFQPSYVQPDTEQLTLIGVVTYNTKLAPRRHIDKGHILISTRNNGKLTIPYQAQIQQGTLRIETDQLIVHTSQVEQASDLVRSLYAKNTFSEPLVVYNITMSDCGWLKKTDMKSHLIMLPKSRLELSKLTFNSAVKRIHGSLSTLIDIYTNVSVFTVPVHVYDGKLQMAFQHNSKELDFGSLGFDEKRELFFTLRNNNPVNVEVSDLYSTSVVTEVQLFGVEAGNGTTLTRPPDWSKIKTNPLILKPNHFAVYKVKLIAPSNAGNYLVDIRVNTNFDTFYVPVRFKTSEGSVKSIPEKIIFDKAFPTKVPFKVLKIRSSFAHYTEVIKVSFLPEDSRFRYEPTKNTPIVLEPFQDTVIGHVYFDANNGTVNDSYAGLPLNSPGGLNWIAGLTLLPETDEVDTHLYKRFISRWTQLKQRNTVNVTVQVDTEWIPNFRFPAQAHLIWPTLLQNGSRLRFPPTQIGNMTANSVVVENPTHTDVTIQILPLSLYPNPKVMVDMLMSGVDMRRLKTLIDYEEKDVFTLQNLEKYNRKSSNPVPGYRQAIKENYGVMPHTESISTTLLPGVRVSVLIGFQPKVAKSYVSMILIRNNLTVVDALIVSGKGATSNLYVKEAIELEDDPEQEVEEEVTSSMTSSGHKQRKDKQMVLHYEIKESSLRSCLKTSAIEPKYEPSFYELRNAFTLHNNGTLPVYIHGFDINGVPCSHKAFRVSNCTGFNLAANSTRVVDLIYYPDFSNSRIEAQLTVLASNNLSQNLSLSIDIPLRLLAKCRQSLPRPEWEQGFFYMMTVSLLLLLVTSLLLSYFDMRRVFSESLARRLQRGDVFDLRQAASAAVCNSVKSNGVHTKPTSPTHQINTNTGSELKRRSKTVTENAYGNGGVPHSSSKQQKPGSQPAQRNSHIADNGTKAAESRKQANSRAKPAPSNSNKPAKVSTGEATPNNPQLLSPGKTSNNSSKQLNNAAPQQNSTGTQASVPNKDKVSNNLVNGHASIKLGKQNNTSRRDSGTHSNGSTPQRPSPSQIVTNGGDSSSDSQAEGGKHNHRNNLLKVDNCTLTVEGDLQVEADGVADEVTEKVLKEVPNGVASEASLPALSEEARAKLQQNSRAQLKKQQKKSSQKVNKVNKKATTPAMITKSVGTGDLEAETSSVSTDSGSAITDSGKRKHVTEWLHKLPDKSSDSWTLPTHSQTVSISDQCSVASEAPSWDTVNPDTHDDLSELADQTRSFAETHEQPATQKQFEPIGTKPQKSKTTSSSWDFPPPPATSMRTPSPLDNVLQTPHSMSSGLPAVPLTETILSAGGHMTAGGIPAAGSLTMMQRLQMDRRRQLEEYKARQQQEAAMNDWPGFSDPSPLPSGGGIWNSPQYWTGQSLTDESSTWGSMAPNWNSWWGNQANGATISTPTSMQNDIEGRYDPFLSNVWSPSSLIPTSTSMEVSGRQDPAASLWNYEEPVNATPSKTSDEPQTPEKKE